MSNTEIAILRDKAREWQRIASREAGRMQQTYQKIANAYARMADDLNLAMPDEAANALPRLPTSTLT